MDDALLHSLRQDPTPEFATRLRARLKSQEPAAPSPRRWPLARIAASAAIVGGLAGLLSVPAVRASAQSFLNLFRVVNFVAVPVDDRRVETLKQLDVEHLIGEQVQVVRDGGPPARVASLAQAGVAAGFDVRVPGWLPDAAQVVEMSVNGEHVVRVVADATRLQQLMDALGIDDLRVPEGLDGQTVTIRVPPVAMVRWEHGGRHSRLFQTTSPEVAMPAGVNPAALGEIGLRIAGLPADDARQFARAIDWNSTLVVALPSAARAFRQVDIDGHPGLAVQHQPPDQAVTNTVLWSRDGRVYGLVSIQEMSQVLQMAHSVR